VSRVDPHPIRGRFQTFTFLAVRLPAFLLAVLIVLVVEGREDGEETIDNWLGVPTDE